MAHEAGPRRKRRDTRSRGRHVPSDRYVGNRSTGGLSSGSMDHTLPRSATVKIPPAPATRFRHRPPAASSIGPSANFGDGLTLPMRNRESVQAHTCTVAVAAARKPVDALFSAECKPGAKPMSGSRATSGRPAAVTVPTTATQRRFIGRGRASEFQDPAQPTLRRARTRRDASGRSVRSARRRAA
jgi:hypothetical protein